MHWLIPRKTGLKKYVQMEAEKKLFKRQMDNVRGKHSNVRRHYPVKINQESIDCLLKIKT